MMNPSEIPSPSTKSMHGQRGSRRPGEMVPKNGFYFVGLLAGGPADLYRETREHLALQKAVDLRHHWEWKTNAFSREIPQDVDFIMFLKDMAGHPDWDAVRKSAERTAVPVIGTQHKKSIYMGTLHTWGIVAPTTDERKRLKLRDLQRAEFEAKVKTIPLEPPKLVLAPVPAPALVAAAVESSRVDPAPKRETVTAVATPTVTKASRPDIARPETLAALAHLQRLAWEDGVCIMLTGREISVTPMAGE